jgi:hypothetical protein
VPVQERAGRVVDESERPLPHARLDLARPAYHETAYADRDGRFRVRLPVSSTWPLTASDTGFASTTLHLSGNGPSIVFRLKPTGDSSTAETERLGGGCCPHDLFTYPER